MMTSRGNRNPGERDSWIGRRQLERSTVQACPVGASIDARTPASLRPSTFTRHQGGPLHDECPQHFEQRATCNGEAEIAAHREDSCYCRPELGRVDTSLPDGVFDDGPNGRKL